MRYFYRPGHPKASYNGFVSEVDLGDYAEEKAAVNAPILMDRFYENTRASDGTDIGSRRKHREYMKRNGLTVASDFSKEWSNAAKERERAATGDFDHKERREQVARALYQRHKP